MQFKSNSHCAGIAILFILVSGQEGTLLPAVLLILTRVSVLAEVGMALQPARP